MKTSWLPIAAFTLLATAIPAWPDDPEDAPPPPAPGPAPAVEPPPADSEDSDPPAEEPGEEPRTVDLVIQGDEADRWNLDLGGSWNEHDGLYGRVALHTSNFLGRGESFGATVELGDRHDLFELAWRTPFLFGRRQSLGARLFIDASERPVAGGTDVDRRRDGAELTWGRRFGAHHEAGVAYRFVDVAETEVTSVAGGASVIRLLDYTVSSLRPRWVYDSLDDRLNPYRGLRLSAAVEVAGGALGGDSGLVRPELGLTWFRPVGGRPGVRSTFSVRSRLGWLESSGGAVFPQQRYFSGGQDSVRGFRRDSIAATRDDGTLAVDAFGFPLGGDRMAELSLEYHLLFGERFRLVLFGDAGGVAAPDQDFGVDRLRPSAGAELRVSLKRFPVPLRLIYAENLDPLPEDRFDRFSFSLGVSF